MQFKVKLHPVTKKSYSQRTNYIYLSLMEILPIFSLVNCLENQKNNYKQAFFITND